MENFEFTEFADMIMKKMEEEYKSLEQMNVMILGKTGTGKSTLINNMFNERLVETGKGKPVKQEIRQIKKQGFPLTIYDTPGLELKGENALDSLLDGVTEKIMEGVNSGEIGKAIHCIWYCVSTPSHRFEQSEIDFLRKLSGRTSEYDVPVIIVLTQSYSKKDAKELSNVIEKEALPVVKVIPVLAEDYAIDDEYTVKAYGLDTLAEMMYNVIPEALQKTFIAIQKASFKVKKDKASTIIAQSAVSAAATGAVPIPMSDAPILISIQATMIARIALTFGIPMQSGSILTVISGLLGTTGATVLGKTIVANLLKLIPGAGSIAGGAISGATAAALTAALGESFVTVISLVYSGELSLSDLSSEKGKTMLKEILKDRLKIKRDKNGQQLAPNATT